jgi:hypothetical protein
MVETVELSAVIRDTLPSVAEKSRVQGESTG